MVDLWIYYAPPPTPQLSEHITFTPPDTRSKFLLNNVLYKTHKAEGGTKQKRSPLFNGSNFLYQAIQSSCHREHEHNQAFNICKQSDVHGCT